MNKTALWCLVVCMLAVTGTCCAPAITRIQQFTTYEPEENVVIARVWGYVDASWFRGVEQAMQTKDVEAVVLWIDSPGGSVTETRLLAHNLKAMRTKYPDVALWIYSEYCVASGAYWVCMEADSIWISPVAVAGSIGAYSVRVDSSRADSMAGVNWIYLATNANKVKGAVHTRATDAELQGYLRNLANIWDEFVATIFFARFEQLDVAMQRSTHYPFAADSSAVAQYTMAIADGRTWAGYDAQKAGLVDGVYYFDEFVKMLKDRGYKVKTVGGTEMHDFWPGE